MFMQIKALKRNVQKQYSNLSSKKNRGWDKCIHVMSLFDSKTMDLIISCQIGAIVNSYENVTCKGKHIFLIYKF